MIDITKETKALIPWAAKDIGRPNMEGIHFLDGIAMATNGHGLAALIPHPLPELAENYPLVNGVSATADSTPATLPTDAVKDAIKGLQKRTSIPILSHILEGGSRNGSVTLLNGSANSSTSVQPIDGAFPDIANVIPEADTVAVRVGISAEYLKTVGQSMIDAGVKTVTLELHNNLSGPMRFIGHNPDFGDLVVILMPVAAVTNDKGKPAGGEWVDKRPRCDSCSKPVDYGTWFTCGVCEQEKDEE